MSKIILTRGCTANNFDIDGECIYDMSDARVISILDIAIKSIIKNYGEELNEISPTNILKTLVEAYGDFDVDENDCESCGDTVSWSTLEI